MTEEIRRSVQRVAAVLRQFGAREVYLFGSSAEGTSRASSDIDIAVSGIPPRLFFRAMSKAGETLDRPLDLVDLDEDTPFTRYLREKGDLAVVE
jgi:predicted nucleotidyltransferase